MSSAKVAFATPRRRGGPEGPPLQAPIGDVLMSAGTAVNGILALGGGLGGWIRAEANALERALATAGGLLLFYAGSISDVAGLVLFGLAVVLNIARTRKPSFA